jgi:hypothetical protein
VTGQPVGGVAVKGFPVARSRRGCAYTTAALVGIGAMAITTLTSLALARRRSSETNS